MRRIFFVLSFLLVSFAQASEKQEALALKQLIEVPPAAKVDASLVPDESYELPVGEILNQGGTLYCWAFSTFHMLRTYYTHTNDFSADTMNWRKFLNDINSSAKLTAFVFKILRANHGGWPGEALVMMEDVVKPLKHPWYTVISGSSYNGWGQHWGTLSPDAPKMAQSWYESSAAVEKRIRTALKSGAPAVYCTVQHCTTIYGASYRKGVPLSYKIADSMLSKPYDANPTLLMVRLADITTYIP